MPTPAVRLQIEAHLQEFRFHEEEWRIYLHTEVGKDIARRAIRVESAAKRNATGRPGPNVITGRLRGSITWRLGADAESVYADIGTAVLYGPYVELGTRNAPAYPYLRPALQAARD